MLTRIRFSAQVVVMTIMTLGKRFGDPNRAVGFDHGRNGHRFHFPSRPEETAT